MVATRKFLHNKKILLLVKVIAFLNLENTSNYYIKTRDPSLNRTDSAPNAVNSGTPLYPEAHIRCDGCGIAQFTVFCTFPHNLLFSAHFRTFCNFLHISA